MEILNYKISYEYGSDLYTVTAKTNNGKTFTYTFSENRTLKEIRYTLEEIAKLLYVLSFFLAQNEGLYYKNNCRTISALILAIGVLCLMGYLINYISSNYLGV